MKIAMIFGKGLDGCGVQRGAVEIATWAQRNNVQFHVYSMKGRSFARAKGHSMPIEPVDFKHTEIPSLVEKLNSEYDIVILNSYPSSKHDPAAIIAFYENLVKKIDKPVLVGMMHEIKKANIDAIPMILPILNYCDIVYNFSEKTFFSNEFSSYFPSKNLGERTKRFKMWIDLTELKKNYRDVYSLKDKDRKLMYVGRWTSMKDPRRVLDLYPIMQQKDPSFRLALHGIERSIGAKFDIIDHPNSVYDLNFKEYDWSVDGVPTFGPYNYADGMELISTSLFACSFYRLPKEPHNYGDRMEYTQIEIIGCGTIPVFDKHYGEHNFDSNGDRYIDNDYLAVWSSRDDLGETADKLISIANSPSEQKLYRDSSFNFIDREFNADNVLPEMFDYILKTGKDHNKFVDDKSLVNHLFKSDKAFTDYLGILEQGKVPAVGIKQVTNQSLCFFEKKARREFANYKVKKVRRRK